MIKPLNKNTLYYGDNLPILQEYIPDESVDLIYLDPPFNSNRSYNVLFKDESGLDSEAQITAFEDTWHWGEDAERTYHELVEGAPSNVSTMISALREFIGANQMMAYLTMMTARLIELHRVLKPNGSIYLHCDPTASHYLKVVLDSVFGADKFVNEIVWQRTSSHNDSKKWASIHDIILFYRKGNIFTWNPVYTAHDEDYVEDFYRYTDERGRYRLHEIIRTASMGPRPNLSYEYKGYKPEWGWRMVREKVEKLDEDGRIEWSKTGRPYLKRYLHEQEGNPINTVITDIQPLNAHAAEKLGYPTQKPLVLLERIIQASSNEGDVVLDPFCGCGTAIAAAEKLKRKWIGIDITHLSISLMKYRLKDMFGLVEKKDYAVVGEPESMGGARQLAMDDRYQFQWWALSLVPAKPLGGESGAREGKKGSDKGIDGVINFVNEKGKTERALLQVKSGNVSSRDIRDLRGTVEREGAAIGLFITLEEPSKDMAREAISSGFYHSDLWQHDYQRIQILTIEELLGGKKIDMPKFVPSQFKQAEKVKKKDASQDELF